MTTQTEWKWLARWVRPRRGGAAWLTRTLMRAESGADAHNLVGVYVVRGCAESVVQSENPICLPCSAPDDG